MAFTELSSNLNIIQALDRYPNTNDGLTYAQLQAKFDEAAGIIKTYLNDTLLAELASTTDSSAGADNVGATAITSLTGTTVQALLESLRNNLKATTDGSSGADFVAATGISGLTGATVQELLESLASILQSQTDGSSGGDFVKLTQIGGLSGTSVQDILESLKSFVDTGDSNLSGALAVHKSSDDHDGRYYTETEVDGFAVKLTGNQTVEGVKTFSSFPVTPSSAPTTSYQASNKKYVDDTVTGVVLGQIPDNSLTDAKLDEDIKIGSLASLTTAEKGSVIGAINEHDTAIKTTLPNLIKSSALENSIELAKGLFTVQSQVAAGLNSLSQMAIDVFNDENGIASKTNEDYDGTNKLYKPDTAGSAKTVTANGTAKISTAQSKFGGASGLFDGDGDYLSTTDSADWDFGSGDFTIDFWFRFANTGTLKQIFSQPSSSGAWSPVTIIINASEKLIIYSSSNGSSYDIANGTAGSTTLSKDTWYHLAVVRNGTSLKVYLDGTEEISVTTSATLFNSDGVFRIGSGNGGNYFNGYIDEFRVSKGIARWTDTFTPPTSAYTGDTYTKLLLHMDGTNGSTTFTDDYAYVTAMTLISNALTCSSAPTYGYVVVDDTNNSATITYYLSRDNGSTWTQVTEETLTDLTGQPSGTSLKIKAVTSGGIVATPPEIKAWAFGYK